MGRHQSRRRPIRSTGETSQNPTRQPTPQRRTRVAALCAARSKTTFYGAKFRRITTRRGPSKALVAVEHAMLIAAWNMLTNSEFYRDPGPDYYLRRNPTTAKPTPSPPCTTSATTSPSNHSPNPPDNPTPTTPDRGGMGGQARPCTTPPSPSIFVRARCRSDSTDTSTPSCPRHKNYAVTSESRTE